MNELANRRWPASATASYIKARRELAAAEWDLLQQVNRVTELRRAMPPGGVVDDYTFSEALFDNEHRLIGDRQVSLSTMTGDGRPFLCYHLMLAAGAAEACPMCSLWVDGFNGVADHIAQHATFAVIAQAPIAELAAWGQHRGWRNVRLLSSHGSTFNADMAQENADGQAEGVAVYVREGEAIRHVYTGQAAVPGFSEENGMDLMSPIWGLLDLLPAGRGDWYAGHDYVISKTPKPPTA